MKHLATLLLTLLTAAPLLAQTIGYNNSSKNTSPADLNYRGNAATHGSVLATNSMKVLHTDLAAGTTLTIGKHYYDDLSANRSISFSGTPAEGDWVQLHLVSTNNPVLTIPSSLRVGLSYAAITSLTVSNGVHTLAWHRVDGLWYLHDTVPTSSGSGVGVTDGDKGEIIVSGSGTVWEIDDGVIGDNHVTDISITKITGLESIAELESHLGTNIITEDEILLFDSNWEAVGSTNSSLAGEARMHSAVITNTLTILGAGGSDASTLTLETGDAPDTPGTDQIVIYAKTDNYIYSKDEEDIERNLSTRTGSYRTIWVDAGAMVSRTTAGALAGTEELASNDIMVDFFAFDDTTAEAVQFKLAMPDEWDRGTVKAKVFWYSASATTSHTAVWGVKARAVSNDDALDGTWGSEIEVSDDVIAAGDLHVTAATSAITVGGTPQLGDLIMFEIDQDSAEADHVGDVKLTGVMIQYKESDTEPTAW